MTWLTDLIESGTTVLKTRNGESATEITHFKNKRGAYCIVATVSGDFVGYTDKGEVFSGRHNPLDLMQPKPDLKPVKGRVYAFDSLGSFTAYDRYYDETDLAWQTECDGEYEKQYFTIRELTPQERGDDL